MELKECSQSWQRGIKPDFCCSKHRVGHQIKLFPPHTGFSSMGESVRIHTESLIWYKLSYGTKLPHMKEKIARRVHTADLAGQPLQAVFAIPPSLASPRLKGTLQSPDMFLWSRQLHRQGCCSLVAGGGSCPCV